MSGRGPSVATPGAPGRDAFTRREWDVIRRLNTPRKVQLWLNSLSYNTEARRETLRSFRGVVRTGMAHCLEAALSAAVVLEQHGYPPIVMSLESQDWLDHVVFLYQRNGLWGSIARSRDPGLNGRKPMFRSPRTVALSYIEGYVDYSGRLRGYGVANLAEALPHYDWRFSTKNVWQVEQLLIKWPHKKIKTSTSRYRALRAYYVNYREKHGRKPWRHYSGRERWMPLPREFS
jgi:hypothetical protein